MVETAARLRHHRTSPTKIRQVLRLIVGKDVADAREILRFCERGPAETVMKLLDSAIANAEHNRAIPAEELYLAQAWCDEGPTRKSGQPRARGRYFRVRKRSSHMTIVLARFDADELAERRRREESTGRGASSSQRQRAERVRRSRQRQEAAHDHDHDHAEEAEVDETTAAPTEATATGDAPVAEVETDETPAADDATADDATTDADEEAGEE